MMKVKNFPADLGYQKYFEAFVQDKASYPLKDDEVEEDALSQASYHSKNKNKLFLLKKHTLKH